MPKRKTPGLSLDQRGRSKREAKFVCLRRWVMESEAYRHAPLAARCLLVEIMGRHNSWNNGEISMSVREAATLLNTSIGRASKAFVELQDLGFIRVNRRGAFTVEINPEATSASNVLDLSVRELAEIALPAIEQRLAG